MVTPATVSRTTNDLYNQLGPWKAQDSGFLLLALVASFGELHDSTEQYTRDDATHTGWGQLMDVAACPFTALPWLAQLAGVSIPAGSSDANARLAITSQSNTNRGTVASITGAIKPFLTGTQRVEVYERWNGAYGLKIVTYTSETSSSAGTLGLAAMTAVKPAGIILTYVIQAGITWGAITGTWASHPETWASLSNELPP